MTLHTRFSSLIALLFVISPLKAQVTEYVNWTASSSSGTGTFATLSNLDFSYTVGPSNKLLTHTVSSNHVFDGSNNFESTYGQADNAENLRLGVGGNTGGTITETINLVITFNSSTPAFGWAFALVDFDVDQAVISAIDASDQAVSNSTISSWFKQTFDADGSGSTYLPHWDGSNAALLGNSPSNYTSYSTSTHSNIFDNEAASAYFEPNVSLKSLTIQFESISTPTASYHIFIAGNESLLPLRLTHFDVQAQDHSVLVDWKTESDNSVVSYAVEHSSDNINYESIYVTPPHLDDVEKKYTFTDFTPAQGFNYYRIKQIEEDGSVFYSEIESINFAQLDAREFAIYPNPAQDYLRISGGVEETTLILFDVRGQVIFTETFADLSDYRLDLGDLNLPSGCYFLNLKTNGLVSIHRVTVL